MSEYTQYRLALQQRLAAKGKTPAEIRAVLAEVDAKAAARRMPCRPCQTGHVPDAPVTFAQACYQCAGKRAEGRRTGNEPEPATRLRPARMPAVLFAGKVALEQAARKRQRAYFGARLAPAHGGAT